MQAKCSRGGKRKRNRCPRYTTASRLMNTKPLCLSHLEIDRWKLSYYFSLTFRFIFQLISPLHEYLFCTSPTPTPITFLMVHLTLRAEPPNLLSDTKWSSERMVRCAAERVRGPSLSLYSGGSRGGARGETCPSPYLRIWMIAPPSYLKVWIRHCYLPPKLLQYVTYAVTLRRHGSAEAGEHKEEHIVLLKVH